MSLLVWTEKLHSAIDAVADMLHRVRVIDNDNSYDSCNSTSNSRDDPFGLGSIGEGRYQAIEQIGEGSYGSVISAYDRVGQTKVAVKKIRDVFDDLVDAKRVVREIRALRCLNHDNIIRLVDLPMPPSPQNFRDIYIVTELMDQDLYSVIYHHEKLSTQHIQFILYQILCALKYIHSAGVIHRDLTPKNILISSECKVKLCDFGLARCLTPATGDSKDRKLTQYVVTRWYRAPEILLGCETYTEAVDVWGLGCILGEMLQRAPLFPGDDNISQIRHILGIVGRPEEQDRLDFITNPRARKFVRLVAPSRPVIDTDAFFPDEDASIRYLLMKMLALNPSERISVKEILSNTFFESIRAASMEKAASRKLIWDMVDDVELTENNLKILVYKEVDSFAKRKGEQERRDETKSY